MIIRRRTRRETVTVSLCGTALLGLASLEGWSATPYAELTHASNARTTDRDLGRNFVHLGWEFANGIMISAGAYLAGEKNCFESVALAKRFAQGRWQVSLNVHDEGLCSIDSRQVPYQRNAGLCASRTLPFRAQWSLGVGGCLWQHADYTIGNLADPNDPLSVIDDGLQLTAMLQVRFDLSGRHGAHTGATKDAGRGDGREIVTID